MVVCGMWYRGRVWFYGVCGTEVLSSGMVVWGRTYCALAIIAFLILCLQVRLLPAYCMLVHCWCTALLLTGTLLLYRAVAYWYSAGVRCSCMLVHIERTAASVAHSNGRFLRRLALGVT